MRSHVAKGPYMNQARSGSRVNWRRVWPLIDLATGITGLALLIVGDLGGNRPLRAIGVVVGNELPASAATADGVLSGVRRVRGAPGFRTTQKRTTLMV